MKITPKTEKEIAEANLWPAGIYNYQIAQATDEVSKSGNEMIKLALNVYSEEGACRVIYDYLLDAIPHKIRHLCEVSSLLEKYENGTIYAEDFVDKTGNLKLVIQKDKTGQYADKNTVADYVAKDKNTSEAVHPAFDDEIPFK